MRVSYVVAESGERVPIWPEDGQVVTCEACGRELDVLRLCSGPDWWLTVTLQSRDVGTFSVQGDVCGECRERPFAEIVRALTNKLGPEPREVAEKVLAAAYRDPPFGEPV